MKILGNINSLKKSIEQSYNAKLKAIEEETKQKIAEINNAAKKQMDETVSKLQLDTESDVSKTYSRILSEETMEVKKKYEEEREACIREVFSEAEKQADKKAHSPVYMKYLASKAPKGKFDVIGDSQYYKKKFSKIKVVKQGFHGIKLVSDDVTYDFSIESAIASKKDILRHKVNEVLFG